MRRRTSFGVRSGRYAAALLATIASVRAQEPSPVPPRLPTTEIEGGIVPAVEPPAPVAPQFQPPVADQPFRSIFESAPVEGYAAPTNTVGGIVDLADIELPATVTVLPEAVVRDQVVRDFQQLIRNIPGAVEGRDGLFPDRFFLRGFEVGSRDFRKNGFLDPTYTPRDFANVDRVEILQGPASMLYGSASPAGTVNLITKKPVDADFGRFAFGGGSFGSERYTLDRNGRLNEDGSLLLRFNGSYENRESFRDFGFLERHMLAPVVSWRIDEDTLLTWEGEIHKDRRRGDPGMPNQGTNTLAYPPNTFVGDPSVDQVYSEDYRTSLTLQKQLNDEWSLYIGQSSLWYEFPATQTFAAFQVGPTQYQRFRSVSTDREQSHSVIANLAGDGLVGGLRHRVLFGTEHVWYDSNSLYQTQAIVFPTPFDVAAPNYSPAAGFPISTTAFPVYRQYRHGYYLQDFVDLSDRWQVLAGVRFDHVDFEFEQNPGGRFDTTYYRTTPRVGVVHQIMPEALTAYFNFGQSFNPPSGASFGATLPELGTMYEAGLKAQVTEDLIFNVAAFRTEQKNRAFRTLGFTIAQTANAVAQGLEFSLLGKVTDRWSTISNFSYVDTELTDGDIFNGRRERNVPYSSASFWNRYDLVQRDDFTLGTGLGVTYVGSRLANLSGTLELPSYTRWDAAVYAQRGRWDATFYVENLFDIDYALGSNDAFPVPGAAVAVLPGAPTNLRLEIGVSF